MITLTDKQLVLLSSGLCPVCLEKIDIDSNQTEEQLMTVDGTCYNCSLCFAMDITLEGELLGGHSYTIKEWNRIMHWEREPSIPVIYKSIRIVCHNSLTD